MQQHPVPQNVTQYQFRLVGDMTLKQFLELAGGLVLAWLFYASNLIFFIKWPLALLSLFFGIALAFFPIEDRPLDVWILNFIRSIYSPTRFIWKKTTRLPALFSFKPHEVVERATATKTIKAPPITTTTQPTSDLSEEEVKKLQNLDSLLTKLEKSSPTPKTSTTPATANKPSIKVRQLKSPSIIFQSNPNTPSPALSAQPSAKTKPPLPEPKNITIPTTAPTSIPKQAPQPTPPPPPPQKPTFVAPPTSQPNTPTTPTQPAENINLPAAPKKPNLVVGMITDKDGRLVNNAIVEISTKDGLPARAIKTNSLGQFYISTPLNKGEYTIEVDKDGLTFPPQLLKVEDKLILPLILRAS